MGNASSTTQKIHNIISTNVSVDAVASARVNCTQELEINAVKLTNCPIVLRQECFSMANASLDTVISALQNAELDKESKQVVDGLALGMNVDVSNQDLRQEVLNTLHATCKAEAETILVQRPVVNIDLCDGSPIKLFQYGDAGADCVVKTIVDSAQKSKSSAKTDQTVLGLQLPNSGGMMMMIIGAAVLFGMIGMSGGGDGGEGGQNLARRVVKAKRTKFFFGKGSKF
jgi:hypothetical protein